MNAASLRVITGAPEVTEQLGNRLAALLPFGAVVALFGDLATGKTCLVRGMASFFGPGLSIHSPTFTLVNEYGRETKLYHLDLYRIHTAAEVIDLGFEDLFEPDGVAVIEWAERALPLLPARRLDIHFEHAGGDARNILLTDYGLLPSGWKEALAPTQT